MRKNKKLNLPIIDLDVDLIQQQSLHTYGKKMMKNLLLMK